MTALDTLGPFAGPCGICGGPDKRHRLGDALRERHASGETAEELAEDYGLEPERARAFLEGPRRAVYAFTVRGLPKAQPRPKAFKRGAHAGVYDPGTAGEWKALVAHAARAHRPAAPLEGPLSLSIDFLMPRPKSLMRKRDPDGELPHIAKPDRDNLEKAVLDALTQDGWWRDDAQVCAGEVRKFYHAKDGVPGARIEIGELVVEGCGETHAEEQEQRVVRGPVRKETI